MSNWRNERQPAPSSSDSDEEDFEIPQPPVNCSWKRPTLLYVTRGINLYMRVEIFREVTKILSEVGGNEALEIFKSGIVGRLIDVRRSHSASNALHHVLARQLKGDDIPQIESWFQIGGETIRFTANDYALITGLHFGLSDFDPHSSHQIPSGSIYYTYFKGEPTKVSELRKKFKSKELGKNVENYLKAANLLVYYLFLLCRDDPEIEDWAWTLVEDFETWDSFPWGSYTYGTLCYYIDNVAMRPNQAERDYHFYGPVWALQIWSYEVIPALGDVCGLRDPQVRLPRCLRWSTRQMKMVDFSRFLDNPRLVVYPSLEPIAEELETWYMMSFDNGEEFDVRYKPPVRIATRKDPKGKSKAMGKLKSIVGKVLTPEARRPMPKRRRESTPLGATDELLHSGQPDRVCCVHGRPCPDHEEGTSGGDDIERRLRAVLNDESDTGFLARLTRKMFAQMKDYFIPRRSISPPQYSPQHSVGSHRMNREPHRHSTSAVDRHRWSGAQEPIQDRPRHSFGVSLQGRHSHHSQQGAPSHHSQQGAHSHHSQHDRAPSHHSQHEQAPSHHSQHEQAPSHHSQHTQAPSHQSQHEHAPSHHSQHEQAPSHHSQHTQASSHHSQHELFVELFRPVQPTYPHFQSEGPSYQNYQSFGPEVSSSLTPHPILPDQYSSHELQDEDDDEDEDDEEVGDRSLGLRQPRPSAALKTPYKGNVPSNAETLRIEYRAFRNSGPEAYAITYETKHVLTQKFFDTLEDLHQDFTAEVIDLYVSSTRARIRRNLSTRSNVGATVTIVVGSAFYAALVSELQKLHPKDPQFRRVKGKPTYNKWRMPDGIDELVKGLDTPTAVPWSNAYHIIAICCINENHWVTVRICLLDWKVELYDSMSHQYDNDRVTERDFQMKPITRLVPRMLALSGYWRNNSSRIRRDDEMELVKMPTSVQFAQTDSHSCGPFACMYLDRLVARRTSKVRHSGEIDEKYVRRYRWLVGCRIFWLSIDPR